MHNVKRFHAFFFFFFYFQHKYEYEISLDNGTHCTHFLNDTNFKMKLENNFSDFNEISLLNLNKFIYIFQLLPLHLNLNNH